MGQSALFAGFGRGRAHRDGGHGVRAICSRALRPLVVTPV
jgi:hypothetical protein